MHRTLALCLLLAMSAPALAAQNCDAGGDDLMAAMQAVVDSNALENAETAEECVTEANEFRAAVDKVRTINGKLKGCPTALTDDQMQVVDNIVTETEGAIAACAEVAAAKAAGRKAAE
jgi:hypothetical protein